MKHFPRIHRRIAPCLLVSLLEAWAANPPPARVAPSNPAPLAPSAGPARPGANGALAGRPAAPVWPDMVEAPLRNLNIVVVEEKPADRRCVYRSAGFEFTSEDKLGVSVMREIARAFEATRIMVQALPWGIQPKAPPEKGFFQATFHVSPASYVLAGGPPNSGGVYLSKDRVFRIPFPSLGLEQRGRTWYRDEGFDNRTMLHEVTHQMMHDQLAFAPNWLAEGCAEYVSMLPYRAGRFRAGAHRAAIQEYLKEAARQDVDAGQISGWASYLRMSSEEWDRLAMSGPVQQRRLYVASCVAVYVFNHLDGDAKGGRFLRVMEEINRSAAEWQAFLANPLVKKEDDGRYTFPSTLQVPANRPGEVPPGKLADLLLDGRSDEQLDAAIRTALKGLGIR